MNIIDMAITQAINEGKISDKDLDWKGELSEEALHGTWAILWEYVHKIRLWLDKKPVLTKALMEGKGLSQQNRNKYKNILG